MSQIENFRQVLEQLPRRQRPPSERNLWIYQEIRVAGRMQHEVAASLGVCQQRISAIVRQVERWRAASELAQRLGEGQAERGPLEERLERGRLERIYQLAMQNYDRPRREVKSIRKRYARRGEWSEQTVREWERDPRLLKAALRTLGALDKLSGKPAAIDPQAALTARYYVAAELLVELRRDAERAGMVPKDRPALDAVDRLLRELTGLEQPSSDDDQPGESGTHCSSHFCRNEPSGAELTASSSGASDDWPASCVAGAERKSAEREAAP